MTEASQRQLRPPDLDLLHSDTTVYSDTTARSDVNDVTPRTVQDIQLDPIRSHLIREA